MNEHGFAQTLCSLRTDRGLTQEQSPPHSEFLQKRYQNGRTGFLIVKDTTPKSTLTLPTKSSMIIFDSKQNRPNPLHDFGRLFDVISLCQPYIP